ncbi:O-antigen ligase family protein [Microbacterium sp.]|uniref:O-antigen ligase family protein n=1 Tax=Microbacterium sp. TaxID=51671 RepID=UPI0035695368
MMDAILVLVAVFLGGAAIALAAYLLFLAKTSVTILATLGCVSLISGSSVFLPPEQPTVSIIVRAVGALILAFVACRVRALTVGSSRPPVRVLLTVLLVPIVSYLCLATAPFGYWDSLISYLAGAVLLILTVLSARVILVSGELKNALVASLVICVAGSLLIGIALPSVGLEGGRLRGLLENANALGAFAFFLGVLALVVVDRRSHQVVIFAIAFLAIVWSASRASLLAVVVFMALLVAGSIKKIINVVMYGILVLALFALAYVYFPSFFDLFAGITRSSSSRDGTWNAAIEVLSRAPWTGDGLGSETVAVASSPLRAAVYAGYPGLISILVLWIMLLVWSARIGPRTFAFVCAAVVHSFFEGWLLSTFGPIILLFALVVLVIMDVERNRSFQKRIANDRPSGLAVTR